MLIAEQLLWGFKKVFLIWCTRKYPDFFCQKLRYVSIVSWEVKWAHFNHDPKISQLWTKKLSFGATYSPHVIQSIAKVLARIFLCVISHALEHFKHLIKKKKNSSELCALSPSAIPKSDILARYLFSHSHPSMCQTKAGHQENMLNNFCFHVYAQVTLSLTHSLSL